MAREVAPTNQWPARGVVGGVGTILQRLYPAQDYDSDVWGWTEVESEAEGIVGASSGVLGVDDATVTGGAMVFDYSGAIAALVTS